MKRIILSIVAIIMGAFIAFGPPSYYIFTNDSQAATSSSNSSDFKKAANAWVAGVSNAVNNTAKKTGNQVGDSEIFKDISPGSSSSSSVSVPATSDSSAVGSTTDADTPEASPEISSEAAYSGSENEGCVKTAIIGGGEVCDDGNGSSIYQILNLIVDIMTIGVGILGVVGISVAGIMYLTAGDKEDQTKKAKRRLLEIVIGLVLYVVAYALLKWLLPGFNGTGGV